MKLLFTLLLSFTILTVLQADDKYIKSMKKNIQQIDSSNSVEEFMKIANNFERIANAEKDKWLPYYYASFAYTLVSFTDSSSAKKDGYLDQSDKFVNIADSLSPNNSEIYTLKGMIAQARMQVDPMSRWMKYGQSAGDNFKKAIAIDSTNPRPEYLTGIGVFYTPEQFGGGVKAAKPILESSLKKYNAFKPSDELMPIWGRERVESLLNEINGETPSK